jgi:hypothetical protein
MDALINVVVPVFGVVLTGYLAGRFGVLGADSAAALNRFVFYFALPPALFIYMARAPVEKIFNWPFIGGLGLAVFAFSTFTPTQQFGYLMVTLLSAALVGDLVLLPSLLASPLGEVFAAGLRKRGVKKDRPSRPSHAGPPPAHIRRDSPHRSVRT